MKDRLFNHKDRLLRYGFLLLVFLIGLALPSPIFRNGNKATVEKHDKEYADIKDTIGMKIDGGLYNGTISRTSLKRNGQGQYIKKDGSVYEGEWVEDRLEYGKRTTSGSVYIEHFDAQLNNDGFGIISYNESYIDGKSRGGVQDSEIVVKYIGNWRKDLKHGLGRAIKKDNSMDFGMYSEGLLPKTEGARYRVGGNVYGIDVSHWQTSIDWDNLALYCDEYGNVYDSIPKDKTFMQPVFFVYVKATDGDTYKDKTFYDKTNEAKNHGIVKGAYHVLDPQSAVDDQLTIFFETVTWIPGDLPPALDVEADVINKIGGDSLQIMTLEWLEKVEQKFGVRPIIYTSESIRNNYYKDPKFNTYQFWISRYSQSPDNHDWKIWQRTKTGQARGYKGDIDIDIYRDDYDSFERYLKAVAGL